MKTRRLASVQAQINKAEHALSIINTTRMNVRFKLALFYTVTERLESAVRILER